jgi:hypothetical protein
MSISDATISVDVFNEIRASLVASAIKITEEGGATKTATVTSAYANDRKTIPQIVINPIAKTEEQYKFGKTTGRQFINVTVDCYYVTTRGVEQLSDAVETAIKATTFSGMELVGITTDFGFVDPNFGQYQIKSHTFTFDRE